MDNEGGFYNKGGKNDGISHGASSDELKNSEQSFYHGNQSDALGKEDLGKAEGKKPSTASKAGLYAIEQFTPIGKVVHFLGKHKKGSAAAGGGVTALIVTVVALFGFIAAHELVTIEQDMLRYEDKSVSYVEKKAANQIMKRVICNHISPTSILSNKCSKIKQAEGEKLNQPNEDPIAAAIDQFDLTNPEVIASLNDQGISLTQNSDGQINGFKDQTTGKQLTFDDLNSPEIQARLEAALPEWDVGQIETLRPLAIEDVGATFDVFTGPSDPVDKTAEDSVMSGESSDPASIQDPATEEPTQTPPGESATAAATAATDAASEVSGTSSILGSAWSAIKDGKTITKGLGEVETAAKFGQAGLINTAITMICAVKNAADKGSKNRIPTIVGLLVRHATTLISVADEMKVGGSITGKQISGYTNLYNGVPKAGPTSSQTIADASKPFSESAAWKRISGNPSSIVTNPHAANYTPDINKSSLPVENKGSKVVNQINGVSVFTGLSTICSVDHGISGDVIGFGMGAVQVVLGGFSLGASQIAITGGVIGLQTVIQHEVIPQIVKYFTPIGLDGLESSVQLLNNSDAGSNILFNMFSQRIGGKPLQNSQAVALASEGAQMQAVAQSQKPFTNRLFAFSNPSSLVSKAIVSLPLSQMAIIGSVANDIVRSPLMLVNSIGSLLGGPKLMALSQDTNPGQPYDVTQYGFTPNAITAYDPINNEAYLYNTTITYSGQSGTLINLLGNPNNFPNATPDPSPNDVFHCFAQTPQNFANELSSTSTDPICGTEGNYDAKDVSAQPINNLNVGYSFCQQLKPGWNIPLNPNYDLNCPNNISTMPQLNNIMLRFRQYLLDDQVTGFYTALTNSQ